LNVKGASIPFSTSYKIIEGELRTIAYRVTHVGLVPFEPQYNHRYHFSSDAEKTEVIQYIREALDVFGFRYGKDGGRVEVEFSDAV
jgi:hypothetical protein